MHVGLINDKKLFATNQKKQKNATNQNYIKQLRTTFQSI